MLFTLSGDDIFAPICSMGVAQVVEHSKPGYKGLGSYPASRLFASPNQWNIWHCGGTWVTSTFLNHSYNLAQFGKSTSKADRFKIPQWR